MRSLCQQGIENTYKSILLMHRILLWKEEKGLIKWLKCAETANLLIYLLRPDRV